MTDWTSIGTVRGEDGRHRCEWGASTPDYAAYHDDVFVDDRTIDSHIKRLRRKFRSVDPTFSGIETLYGAGYSFAAE